MGHHLPTDIVDGRHDHAGLHAEANRAVNEVLDHLDETVGTRAELEAMRAEATDAAATALAAAADATAPTEQAVANALAPGKPAADTLNAAIGAQVEPLADVVDAIPATYAQRPAGSGFLAFGDSITTAQDSSAGGGGYGGAWAQMACALSQQRLNFRGNAGVTGNTSTQIRARIGDALALSPSIVAVLAGANNITASGSDSAAAFATFKDDIRAICTALRAAGIRVLLCTILPRGDGSGMHTATRLATTMKWNAWLREYARNGAEFPEDRGGFELIDFFGLLVNPATGKLQAAYDADGLHPSQAGHLVMAKAVVEKVQSYAYTPLSAQIDVGDTYNLLSHPLLADGAGTPTSWITSGTASTDWTEAAVTDADFKGRAWEVAFTSTTGATNFREFKSFAVNAGAGTFTPGDQILFCLRTKIATSTGVTPSTTAGIRARVLTAGGTPAALIPLSGLSVEHGSALHWFRYTVPAGTTSLQVSSLVMPGAVGANLTVRVGEFGIYNLTALGLA